MIHVVFKMKLAWLKLNVREFAKEIDTPLKHVEAWRQGTRKVPVVIERLIDLMGRNARLEMGTTRPNGAKRTR